MTYEHAIAALADPTRRKMMDRLRGGPMAVGQLAAGLPVSRPAVSQHLRVLSDAGLLTVSANGTRRLYAIRADGVAGLRAWLDTLWDDALAAYARAAHLEAGKDTP
jgi:DNA-binding transcriptional ArsR family regulator